jgi:ketosteroid isomerase-like protein
MMSSNLDLVRSILTDWARGDWSSVKWASPEIEFRFADGPTPGQWTGVAGMREGFLDFLSAWEALGVEPTEYRELEADRVLVLVQFSGRGKTSGLDLGQMQPKNGALFHIRDGTVTELVLYWDRDRMLTDLGLDPAPPQGALREEARPESGGEMNS